MSATESSPTIPRLSKTAESLVLVGLFLAILLAGMDALVVNTALPVIASSLHQSSGITFVVAAYLIASTISIPVFSKLSDRFSRRNVFLAGLVVFIAGSALAGLSQDLGQLIAFRAVQGFGSGGFIPVGISMVAVLFPPEMRARLTGILSGAGGIAIVVGPIVGSYIVDVTTWRWVFYVNLPIGLASMAVLLAFLGPLRPERKGRIDALGALLLSAWVALLMFPLVEVSDAGWAWTAPATLGLLAAALVTFAVFVAWELRTEDPVVPLRLLGRRTLGAAGGVSLFNGIVFTSALTFLSVFVGVFLLRSGPNASNDVRDITYAFAVPMILGAALAGQLLTRAAYRTVIGPALALAAVSTVWLALSIQSGAPLWSFTDGFLLDGGLALPLIPTGFGLGLGFAGTLIVSQNEVTPDQVGATIGIVRFLQSLGGAVGLSLLTAYQAWRLGALDASATTPAAFQAATVTSYVDLFAVMGGIVLVAFLFALLLRGRVPSLPAPGAGAPAAPPGPPSPTRSL